jgi:transcription initiation factor TFIIIB Brf1 subunit/transcription initiation factor TFIIB
MISTNRTSCVECGKKSSFELIYNFENFPVYMGASINPSSNQDLVNDMTWVICTSCGCIQLEKLLDPAVLYHKSHNPSIGKVWKKHHEDFSKFIVENMVGNKILEIGGSNLLLYNNINSQKEIDLYTIFDKHTYSDFPKNVSFVNEYFTTDSTCSNEFDNILNSHTFEHFYNPVDYLKTFSNLLKIDQKLIMSIPNIANMIKDGLTNSLNFEHTFWIDKENLTRMLNDTGFEIENLVDYNKYNFFVSCINKKKKINNKPYNNHLINKQIFTEKFIKSNKKNISKFLTKWAGTNNPKFVFGCHIFTQYFLSFGLKPELFNGILDNDPNKIGHRLYGTNLFTFSPTVLKDYIKPVVFLNAGLYSDEIKQQILSINNGTIIYE